MSANKYLAQSTPDAEGKQDLTDRPSPGPTGEAPARRPPRAARAAGPDAGPALTQDARRAASERRLVAAACEVLARKGWIGMTLAEVGHRAGVSRGLVSHHFGSKAGLLRALTRHIDEGFAAAMRAAPPAAPGLPSVLGYVSVYLGRTDPRWTNTRTLLLLMAEALIEGSGNAPVLAGYMDRMFDYLADNIRVGIARGEISAELSPRLGAEMVIGTLRGLMLQRLVQDDLGDLAAARDQILRMIERSFSPG